MLYTFVAHDKERRLSLEICDGMLFHSHLEIVRDRGDDMTYIEAEREDIEEGNELIEEIRKGKTDITEAKLELLRRALARRYPLLTEKAKSILLDAIDRARDIRDPYQRDNALSCLAVSTSKFDIEKALELVKKTDGRYMVYALKAIAATIEEDDPKKAEELLNEAVNAARTLQGPLSRTYEFISLAGAILEYDKETARRLLEQALEIARKITGIKQNLPQIMGDIAAAYYYIDRERGFQILDEGLEISRAIDSDFHRAMAISYIAKNRINFDPDGIYELFDEAVEIASNVQDLSDRFRAICDVGSALYWYHEEKGLEVFRKAINMARGIEDPFEREVQLYNIKRELNGMPTEGALLVSMGITSDEDLERALEYARKTDDKLYAVERIFKISAALGSSDWKRANKLYDEAISLARSMEDGHDKVVNLSSIAMSISENTALAEEFFAEAMDSARKIGGIMERSHAEYVVAYRLSLLDRERGLAAADEILSQFYKAAALVKIALQTAITDIATALKIFEMAGEMDVKREKKQPPIPPEEIEGEIESAEGLEDPVDVAIALLNLAMRITDRKEAVEVFKRAIKAARTVRKSGERDGLLALLAGELVRVDERRALNLARSIRGLKSKTGAIATVARHIYSGNRELATAIFKEAISAVRKGQSEVPRPKGLWPKSLEVSVAEIDGELAVEMAIKETLDILENVPDEELRWLIKNGLQAAYIRKKVMEKFKDLNEVGL